ncbi:MAG TPA: hypothetical protein VM432_06235 [Bdellovibrionales bacterium]|jgi:hypothetical protein|nr:hypothetical protein [Bdellovibrionales bacterium]
MKTLSLLPKSVLVFSFLTLTAGIAKAAPCDSVNLNGNYAYDEYVRPDGAPGNANKVQISQNGCEVKITDRANKAEWILDLSGKTLTSVPASIIKANSTSGVVAKRAFESMKIRTVLKSDDWGPHVEVTIVQDIPKTPDTRFTKGSLFNVQVKMTGKLALWGDGPSEDKIDRVHSIHLAEPKVRVVGVSDPALPAPLDQAFMSGANYVLRWTDGAFGSSFAFLNLRRVK